MVATWTSGLDSDVTYLRHCICMVCFKVQEDPADHCQGCTCNRNTPPKVSLWGKLRRHWKTHEELYG
jgi:hypothetical protein